MEEPPLVGGLYGEDALVILDALEPWNNFVLDDFVPLFPEENFFFDVGIAPQNLLKGLKDHILEVARIVFLRNSNSEDVVDNAFPYVGVRFQNLAMVYGKGSCDLAQKKGFIVGTDKAESLRSAQRNQSYPKIGFPL